jgi:hypothetical protein
MARRTQDEGLQLGFDMAPILPKSLGSAEPAEPVVKEAAEAAAPPSVTPEVENKSSRSRKRAETDSEEEPAVLSVGELTRRITSLLEVEIGMVWVE